MELELGAADALAGRSSMEPSRRQILAGSTGTAFAIVAGQAAAGLSFLVLARRLMPDEFGIYAVLYTAGVVLGGVLDFGSSQLRTRELAKGSGLDSFTSWLWRRTMWQAPVVLVVIGLSQLVVGQKASLLVTAALISQGLTYPISLGWSGAVRALRSPALGTWLVAMGNVVLLVVVIVAPQRSLVALAAIGASATWMLTAICSWWLTKSRLSPTRTRWMMNPWSGSSGFGFFGLAIALQGLQVVIVGAVAGSAEAGELAAVARWVQPVYLVAAAFSTQTFPGMAAATTDAAARRILRPIWVVSALGGAVAFGIVVFAPWLVDVLLGNDYENSAMLLQALAIAGIPVLFTQPLATFLQARGSERPVAIATTAAVGASLGATAILTASLGALAVPVCFGLAQCLLLGVLSKLASRGR